MANNNNGYNAFKKKEISGSSIIVTPLSDDELRKQAKIEYQKLWKAQRLVLSHRSKYNSLINKLKGFTETTLNKEMEDKYND